MNPSLNNRQRIDRPLALALPGGQFAQKSAIITAFGATHFLSDMRTGD
jgi:hypothetical protein